MESPRPPQQAYKVLLFERGQQQSVIDEYKSPLHYFLKILTSLKGTLLLVSFKRLSVYSTMKPDMYTKIMLTIIALALLLNIVNPLFTPSVAQAGNGGRFGHLQAQFVTMRGMMGEALLGLFLFDTNTGEVWIYDLNKDKAPDHFRLVTPGQPLQSG